MNVLRCHSGETSRLKGDEADATRWIKKAVGVDAATATAVSQV